MKKEVSMYFLLKEGEIIHEHDEYYDPIVDKWRAVSNKRIGEPCVKEHKGNSIVIRRKNKDFRYSHQQWI